MLNQTRRNGIGITPLNPKPLNPETLKPLKLPDWNREVLEDLNLSPSNTVMCTVLPIGSYP